MGRVSRVSAWGPPPPEKIRRGGFTGKSQRKTPGKPRETYLTTRTEVGGAVPEMVSRVVEFNEINDLIYLSILISTPLRGKTVKPHMQIPIPKTELDELEWYARAASAGTWRIESQGDRGEVIRAVTDEAAPAPIPASWFTDREVAICPANALGAKEVRGNLAREVNARFIVLAYRLVLALLEENRQLRATLAELKARGRLDG